MGELAQVANLGPKSETMLLSAGIKSYAQLVALGAVPAYMAVKKVQSNASLNLLWALQGALSGRRWQDVAREDRLSLLLQVEQYDKSENKL